MTSAKNVDLVDPPATETENDPSPVIVNATVPSVWVLCRKRENGEFESLRSFDDEARARADLELVQSVSGDEFWLAAVPLVQSIASFRTRRARAR